MYIATWSPPALAWTAADEAMDEPWGENAADSALEDGISSGLGGLGFEGMVGREEDEPLEAGTDPPEEGRSGAISGEISGREGKRGSAIRATKEQAVSAVKSVMTQKQTISANDADANGDDSDDESWESDRISQCAEVWSEVGFCLSVAKKLNYRNLS